MSWIAALKKWNEGKDKWTIPRKGTAEHAQVIRIMEKMKKKGKGNTGSRDKAVGREVESRSDIIYRPAIAVPAPPPYVEPPLEDAETRIRRAALGPTPVPVPRRARRARVVRMTADEDVRSEPSLSNATFQAYSGSVPSSRKLFFDTRQSKDKKTSKRKGKGKNINADLRAKRKIVEKLLM
jgi:hypothetical protein